MTIRHISELVTIPAQPIGDDAQRERAYRVRDVERRRDDLLRAIGVPASFQSYGLPTDAERGWDVEETVAMAAVMKYHAEGKWEPDAGQALILAGPTGVGKTLAACALINTLLVDLRAAQRFTLASALARRLTDYHQVDETMEIMTHTRLLVIDDLGDLEPRALGLIEEVLIVRQAEFRPVVITTNLTPQRLAEQFSDRINDRLRAWGQVVRCTGASLRKGPKAT